MTASISEKLSNWIAQSESWQSFHDFKLPEEEIADYTIIKRYDDFFISLYCITVEILNSDSGENKDDLLFSLAKGLETFSLKDEAKKFYGINFKESLLLSASLKYLAGFTSSARLTSFPLKNDDFITNDMLSFVLSFLKREIPQQKNKLNKIILDFMKTGEESIIENAYESIAKSLEDSALETPIGYTSAILAKSLLQNFSQTNIWNSVKKIENDKEFWVDYVHQNFKSKIWNFFPSQAQAIEQGIVHSTESFSMQMPTSAGKTALCELIIYYHLKKNKNSKVILLAPFRALASELKISMGKRLKPYGIKVKGLYGGNAPTTNDKQSIDESNLLIATPEKMMGIEDVMPEVFLNVSLVICDEGHLLDDSSRGFDYELFITRLKILKENTIRFIYLSAIVPNINDVNSWLGGSDKTIVESKYRPTTIELAIVKKTKVGNYFLEINSHMEKPANYNLHGFIIKENYKYLNHKTNRQNTYKLSTKKSLSVACALKSLDSGVVAIFSPTKGKTGVKGLCGETIKQVKAISDLDLTINSPRQYSEISFINEMLEYFKIIFSEDYLLIECLRHGFVFHHGTLPQFAREIIESALREDKIGLVICTNTLAEGVNLPLRTIVIHSTLRYDFISERQKPLLVRDLKNLIGRSGRAGKEKNGFIIVPHESDVEIIRNTIENKQLEPVKGFLYNIVKMITEFVSKNNIELSNEVFDNQDEDFLTLIDSIDSAIIDLIKEDMSLSDIDEIVMLLVENTFSFSQSNDEERTILKELIGLRAKKIETSVDEKDFIKLKRSGSNLRIYLEILSKIDLEDDIWFNTDNPLEEKWINFIFNSANMIESCKWEIENFNIQGNKLSVDLLKELSILWMSGNHYGEIASKIGLEVDDTLNIINTLIGYKISNIISIIIRVKEQFLNKDEELPELITSWPVYFQNGMSNKAQFVLFQLGFTEKIGNLRLAEEISSFYGDNLPSEISTSLFLKNNKQKILRNIESDLPKISFLELRKNLSYVIKNL